MVRHLKGQRPPWWLGGKRASQPAEASIGHLRERGRRGGMLEMGTWLGFCGTGGGACVDGPFRVGERVSKWASGGPGGPPSFTASVSLWACLGKIEGDARQAEGVAERGRRGRRDPPLVSTGG